MPTNAQIIRDFVAAWSRLDVDELLGYFAEDGIYHNMPTAPVQGHAKLRQFMAAFLNGWTATEWDILNIQASGDVVMCERLDRTRIGERAVHLPCCGVFELQDGKIRVWRDYFDMATYTRAATG